MKINIDYIVGLVCIIKQLYPYKEQIEYAIGDKMKRYILVLAILAIGLISCGCTGDSVDLPAGPIPTAEQIPTPEPLPTSPPIPTAEPLPTI